MMGNIIIVDQTTVYSDMPFNVSVVEKGMKIVLIRVVGYE
jgi:hypothetical protein